jgi:hypothetical protein
MPTQTKADRQAAAQKAAATRKRNEIRESSQLRGRRAVATRRRNEARDRLGDARKSASSAVSELGSAARSIGDDAFKGWLSFIPLGENAADRASGESSGTSSREKS